VGCNARKTNKQQTFENYFQTWLILVTTQNKVTLVGQTGFSLPVKIQGDSFSFDVYQSKNDNQIALSLHHC
jgi:hypothetical protein